MATTGSANTPSDDRRPRTAVRRLPELAVVDRSEIEAILDAGTFAHVGFVADGWPYVVPMAYARVGDRLYLHGSVASRVMRTLATGAPACVTVTILDGLVLARSAFNTSMNYRSVMVMGRSAAVGDDRERARGFEALLERLVPGHFSTVRPPSPAELRQTGVVRLSLDQCSAKVRTGPPDDDEADYALDVWAGVVPLRLVAGRAVADPRLDPSVAAPASVRTYRARNA